MNRLSHLMTATLVAACALSAPAQAAEITRVLSSFDDNDPFDIDFQIGYSRTMKRSKITQEYHTEGRLTDVLALRSYQVVHEMPMGMRIGVYKDLELSVSTSLVFSDHRKWRLPTYVNIDKGEKFDPATSTILHNRLDAHGNILAEDSPIIDLDNNNESFSKGLGNITVGLKWAPYHESRDKYMPTWVLGFAWTIPTAKVHNPGVPTTSSDRGDVGDGVHRFNFSTSFSKQFGVLDPYISGWYSLPLGDSKRYSNCDDPDSLAYGQNCTTGDWKEDEVSMEAPHMGGFLVGAEIVPWDNREKEQRFSIDIRAGTTFVGAGRTYNELSDALGKLLWTEGYVRVGGSIGMTLQPVKYLSIHADAGLWYETAHLLTGESTGKDLDGACSDASYDKPCIDTDSNSREVNPNFDFRYDVTGRRFRVEATSVFTVNAYLRGQF